MFHFGTCPRIKVIEYYSDGTCKRVEYFEERPVVPVIETISWPQKITARISNVGFN